jgi:hypothetical protein
VRTRLNADSAQAFAFWQSHGPDPKYGGFYGVRALVFTEEWLPR